MPEVHLLRPLWLLALLPLLPLWVLLARQASRRRRWEDLIDPHLRDAVLTNERNAGHRAPLFLLATGWLLLIVALAGPVWVLESRPVYRIEQARVLLLDLTAHMDQVEQGTKHLQRARFELMDLLRGVDEGQVALIGYSAEPFLIAPLTSDAGTVLEQVPFLAPDLLPVAGVGRTDLALDMAGALLQRSGAVQGDVILIAAALERPDLALAAGRRLRAAGHRLSVLAVAEEPVQGQGQASGLAGLASAGGGLLVQAGFDDADTRRLLALPGERKISRSGDRVATTGQWRDDGYWLLLLVLPIAAVAFRRGWLGLLPIAFLVMPPTPAQALSWQDLWLRPEQQAFRALQRNPVPAAAEGFTDPRWRAAAFYRAGQYQQALDALTGQADGASHYNRGNTLARLERYSEAIAEYDAALLIDPEHADARHNRDLLLRLLGPPRAPVSDAPGPRVGGSSNGAEARAESGAETSPEVDGDSAATAAASAGKEEAASPSNTGNGAGRRPRDGFSDPLEDGTFGMAGGDPRQQPGWTADNGLAQSSEPLANESGVDLDDGVPDTAGSRPDGRDASREPAIARRLSGSKPAETDSERATTGQDPIDYWLRQVPDAPEGLLRERLMLQYLRRHGQLR